MGAEDIIDEQLEQIDIRDFVDGYRLPLPIGTALLDVDVCIIGLEGLCPKIKTRHIMQCPSTRSRQERSPSARSAQ